MSSKTEEEVIIPVNAKKSSLNLSEFFPKYPALVRTLGKANLKTLDDLKEAKLGDLMAIAGLGVTRLVYIVRRLSEL